MLVYKFISWCVYTLMLEKNTRRFNYQQNICQNAILPLNGMHVNIPSTECWTPCRAASSSGTAWVGNAYAGRSPLGQSSRYLAMMTRTVPTKLFKAWSMIVILIPVYDILKLKAAIWHYFCKLNWQTHIHTPCIFPRHHSQSWYQYSTPSQGKIQFNINLAIFASGWNVAPFQMK